MAVYTYSHDVAVHSRMELRETRRFSSFLRRLIRIAECTKMRSFETKITIIFQGGDAAPSPDPYPGLQWCSGRVSDS